MKKITMVQCEDESFVHGTCLEVCAHEPDGTGRFYLVGSDVEDGETVIAPLSLKWKTLARWRLADWTILDAAEALQTLERCLDCDCTGLVDRISAGIGTGSVELDAECDSCEGQGYLL